MKKIYLSVALASTTFFGQAHATGIPVFDGANLAQAVQQIVAWGDQYSQMVDQINQAKAEYDSITGIRGFGDAVNNPYLKDIIPSEVGDIYKRPLHKPATYSRHQSQTQLKTGIGVKR